MAEKKTDEKKKRTKAAPEAVVEKPATPKPVRTKKVRVDNGAKPAEPKALAKKKVQGSKQVVSAEAKAKRKKKVAVNVKKLLQDGEAYLPPDHEAKEGYKSGFVSLIGRPNTGKSTLLNAFLKQKVSIVSSVPQTTRYVTRGIFSDEDKQIVFVDTPGLHEFKYQLSEELNRMAMDSLEGVDVILYMVDAKRMPYTEEEQITAMLSKQQTPVIMVINKIDRSERCVGEYITLWQKQIAANKEAGIMHDPLKFFIKISALKDMNLGELMSAIMSLIPEGEPMYHFKLATDFPMRFRVCDAIREKVCHLFGEEVPHHTAVRIEAVERMRGKGGVWVVSAEILLSADSQKHIVVGKGGSMIKEIGIRARKDIEKMLGASIHLDLKVRVERDWFNKTRIINELGYGAV